MPRNSISLSDIPSAPRPKVVRDLRKQRPVEPPLSPNLVLAAARDLGPCTTEHVLLHLGRSVSRANEMAVASVLRRLGYSRIRMMVKGARTYVFYPPTK